MARFCLKWAFFTEYGMILLREDYAKPSERDF